MAFKIPGSPAPKDWPSCVPSVIHRNHLWSHRDFVRLWSDRAVSQFGTQISLVAIPLYAVLALDAGPLQMGLLAGGAGIPRLLLGLVANTWVDRARCKPIMLAVGLDRALTMAIIPLAALLGMASLELVIGVGGRFCAGAWVYWSPVREIGAMPTRPDLKLDASPEERAVGEGTGV
jgi:hypothetical protein